MGIYLGGEDLHMVDHTPHPKGQDPKRVGQKLRGPLCSLIAFGIELPNLAQNCSRVRKFSEGRQQSLIIILGSRCIVSAKDFSAYFQFRNSLHLYFRLGVLCINELSLCATDVILVFVETEERYKIAMTTTVALNTWVKGKICILDQYMLLPMCYPDEFGRSQSISHHIDSWGVRSPAYPPLPTPVL